MTVFLSLLLTMLPAMAQEGIVVFAGQTSTLAVEAKDGHTYTWELYHEVDGLNLATEPGNCQTSDAYFIDGINTGASVEVMWLSPGTYFFTVTAADECSNNLKAGKFTVKEGIPVAYFLDPLPVCAGDPAELTIELAGVGPWAIEYTIESEDIIHTETAEITNSPHTIEVIHEKAGTYLYTITSVTDANGVTNNEPTGQVSLEVLPVPVTSPIERYNPLSEVK